MHRAKLRLLLVEADGEVCRCVRKSAASTFEVVEAGTAAKVPSLLSHGEFDLILLDAGLLRGGASTLVNEVTVSHPRTDIVVMTGFATASAAMEAMRAGAVDYLTKPFNEGDLRKTLRQATERLQRNSDSRRLRDRLRTDKGMGSLIGTSPGMQHVYRILSKVALSNHPALILGESGTGKEAVAKAIHFMGPNSGKPFLVVDCAALPADRAEGELFGIAHGALGRGARARKGIMTAVSEGTIVLDEIGKLIPAVQSKLLRVLQERRVYPVGAAEGIPFQGRVLASSSSNLMLVVEQGQFRKDLYFRLNVVKLTIPPLRERPEDIPMLAQHFLENVQGMRDRRCSFSDESLRLLCDYSWPGNVRELRAAVERMFSISSGPVLHAIDLPTQLQDFRAHVEADAVATGDEELCTAEGGAKVISIFELEKEAILGTIQRLNGDKLLAAKLLGIGKTTLYRKLKEYGEEAETH